MGQAGIRKGELPRDRIEERVERGAIAACDGTHQQALVEKSQYGRGIFTCLVDAAKGTHHKGGIHGGRESFSYHVTQVQTHKPIGKLEKICEVAANFRKRRKTKSHFHARADQIPGRHERVLNFASSFLVWPRTN